MKNKIRISSDAQLQLCINNDVSVEVWVGAHLEEITSIIKFEADCVKTSDGYYLREACKFYLTKRPK